jgi:chromosome segregation ATPase
VRSLGAQEEEVHQTTLNAFKSEVDNLQQLTQQITSFTSSDKIKELEQISSKVAKIIDQAQERKNELSNIVPKMEALQRAVDDQERHKKMLSQNIDILESTERMETLETEILELTSQLDKIDGSATVSNEYKNAKNEKELLQQKKSNYEGRHSSHMDQYYALKVKFCRHQGDSSLTVSHLMFFFLFAEAQIVVYRVQRCR